jgi:hypothetical protein
MSDDLRREIEAAADAAWRAFVGSCPYEGGARRTWLKRQADNALREFARPPAPARPATFTALSDPERGA